jgi:hypothetical protein
MPACSGIRLQAQISSGQRPRRTGPLSVVQATLCQLLAVSVRRAFDIWERLKFTFEASAYNLDGHVDFGGPSTNWSQTSTTFGVVSGQANSPRDIQLSGRFDF